MNKKNLANAQLSTGINSSVTTATVKSGQGSVLPEVPFFATLSPVGVLSTIDNSEIVKVTDKSTDTLTIVRGQRGTAAKSFSADALVVNGIYVEDLSEGTWGSITGTLSNQSDLNAALSGKADATHTHTESDITDLGDYATSTELTTGLTTKANSSHTHATTDLTATGGSSTSFLRKDNTWATPTNTTYSEISEAEITTGTSSTAKAITGRRAKFIQDGTKAVIAQDTAPTDTNKLWYDTDDDGVTPDALTTMLDIVYPVGSEYTNYENGTNPATLLQMPWSTWVAVEGTVTVGLDPEDSDFDTALETGGSKTVDISHIHSITHTHGAADSTAGGPYQTIGARGYTGNSGGMSANSSPSVLQPYIVAYKWRRTA